MNTAIVCKMKKRYILWIIVMACLSGCGAKEAEDTDTEKDNVLDVTEEAGTPTEAIDKKVEETDPSEWFVTVLAEGGENGNVASSEESDGKAPDPVTEYEEIYAPVIAEMRKVMQYGYDRDKIYDYVPGGFCFEGAFSSEVYGWLDPENIGYIYEDVNDDSIPELLIGEMDQEDYKFVFCAYTITDGEVFRFLEGGGCRDHYEWMGDGRFFHYGSGGAMMTDYGEYRLNPEGTDLFSDEYYYDGVVDEQDMFYLVENGVKQEISEEEMSDGYLYYQEKINSAEALHYQSFFEDLTELEGRWYMDSDQEAVGFHFFPDGTWLALGVKNSELESNKAILDGTCQKNEDGSYVLFYSDGWALGSFDLVKDGNGNPGFEFGNRMFYRISDSQDWKDVITSYTSMWELPDGNTLHMDENGRWYLYVGANVTENGYWSIETDYNKVRIRLYNITSQGRCNMIADGLCDKDPAGKSMLYIRIVMGGLGTYAEEDLTLYDAARG